MSENRALAVLEILVHLSASIPDKFALGAVEIPDDSFVEVVDQRQLLADWTSLDPREQQETKRIGDQWVAEQRSAVLSVPSVILGERNYLLNPAHPDFQRMAFAAPEPFQFDQRLLRPDASRRM